MRDVESYSQYVELPSRNPNATRDVASGNRSAARIDALLAVLLLGMLAVLFFYRLAERDLWSSHEARAAQNAQTILDSGDWLLPRLFDRRPDLQKPPLYYWIVAGIARVTGGDVDAWAVRLPAAVSAVGCVLVLWLLGRAAGSARAGLIAGAILATATHFTWLARVGRIDMPLTFAVTLALAGYFLGRRARQENRLLRAWVWFLVVYLASAAAVLLKGPIGIAFPGAIACGHLIVERRTNARLALPADSPVQCWRILHGFGLWWGIPLFLAVTLPWFLAANARTNGELFRVFFWYHNVERGFGGSGKLATHPWWFYGPRFVCDFLPWTPMLLLACWHYLTSPEFRHASLARFGLVWLVTPLFFLSCMRFKRADYLLPAYPGAALFLGCILERWLRNASIPRPACARMIRALARLLAPGLGLVLAGTLAGWWLYVDQILPTKEGTRGCTRFAAAIRKHVPPPMPVILFRTKAHLLTFHLGQPVDTLLEWENLDWWAGRPGTFYVVTTPTLARAAARHLTSGRLVEVLRSSDLAASGQERELILLRTQPHAGPVDQVARADP